MEEFGKSCCTAIVILAMLFVVYLIYALIACWLWNGIVTVIFGAPALTYWQIYGLLWLIQVASPSYYNTSRKD